jgi:hypothetical protein
MEAATITRVHSNDPQTVINVKITVPPAKRPVGSIISYLLG